MNAEVFLILFGVGVAAGMLSGMFGVGGGIVIVPSLLAVYSLIGFLLRKMKKTASRGKIKKIYFVMIGILVGTIAAFTGLGGGIFVIPLLHYAAKVPIRKSIGTSAAAIFITSLSGVVSYIINSPAGADTLKYSIGIVDALSAVPIIITSIPFTQVGVYVNKKTASIY